MQPVLPLFSSALMCFLFRISNDLYFSFQVLFSLVPSKCKHTTTGQQSSNRVHSNNKITMEHTQEGLGFDMWNSSSAATFPVPVFLAKSARKVVGEMWSEISHWEGPFQFHDSMSFHVINLYNDLVGKEKSICSTCHWRYSI